MLFFSCVGSAVVVQRMPSVTQITRLGWRNGCKSAVASDLGSPSSPASSQARRRISPRNYKTQRYPPPSSSSSSPSPAASPPATMRNATSADNGATRRPRPRIAAALTTTTTGPGPTTPAPAHAAAPRAAPVVASRKPAAAARDEPRTIARGSRRSRRSGFFCFTAVQAARAVSRGLSAATCAEIKILLCVHHRVDPTG